VTREINKDGDITYPISVMLRNSLDSLSPSERKVARAILANYPIAGLETIAELAKRAKVSPPTVVRFISRLGLSGYPVFQKALVREVHEQLGSPLSQYDRADRHVASDKFLEYSASVYLSRVADTFAELPQSEFYAAVEMLSDPRRRVWLIGGKFSQILASYLGAHLQLLRAGIHAVPTEEIARLSVVADSGRSDVVIVFDYRRYDPETVRFAQRMADRGCDAILFTDRWLSPAADVASVVLPVYVEAPSPFDSFVPAIAVVESLVAAVTDRIGEPGRTRLEGIESMRVRSSTRSAPSS